MFLESCLPSHIIRRNHWLIISRTNEQSVGHSHQINPFRLIQDPPYQIMWVYCNRSEVKSTKWHTSTHRYELTLHFKRSLALYTIIDKKKKSWSIYIIWLKGLYSYLKWYSIKYDHRNTTGVPPGPEKRKRFIGIKISVEIKRRNSTMIPVEADIALCVIIFFSFLTRGVTKTGLWLREQHLCSCKSF